MGFTDIYNYVLYDNPISKGTINATKSALFGKVEPPPLPNVTIITKGDIPPLWKLAAENGPYIRLAGVLGASAAILGAYGAHKSYPKDREDELKSSYQAANRYHFIHTLALFGASMSRYPKLSGSLFVVGTVIFSGTCYYYAFTGDGRFTKLAPVGGTLLILGWIVLIL